MHILFSSRVFLWVTRAGTSAPLPMPTAERLPPPRSLSTVSCIIEFCKFNSLMLLIFLKLQYNTLINQKIDILNQSKVTLRMVQRESDNVSKYVIIRICSPNTCARLSEQPFYKVAMIRIRFFLIVGTGFFSRELNRDNSIRIRNHAKK